MWVVQTRKTMGSRNKAGGCIKFEKIPGIIVRLALGRETENPSCMVKSPARIFGCERSYCGACRYATTPLPLGDKRTPIVTK